MLKKIKYWLLLLCVAFVGIVSIGRVEASAIAPNFDTYFAKPMLNTKEGEHVIEISCIDAKKTIRENIECLFFPSIENNWGYLWGVLKYVGYILIFIYLVLLATKLLFSGKKPETVKEVMSSIALIIVGASLYFGALWILGSVMKLSTLNTTADLKTSLTGNSGFMFFLLSLAKAGAFFYAIVMIVWTGFKMMNPTSAEEWGGKKLAGNLTGIIAALVGMKIVDFLYYIASMGDFTTQAGDFIIQVAKFMAYGSGAVIVLMIIYTGYQLVIDGGSGENYRKAKQVLTNIVLAVVSLFFFLFLLYQIFSEFN